MNSDLEKEAVARAALNYVENGQIVGLGTGSTASPFVRFLGERVRAGLKVRGVPTSVRTQKLAEECGIPVIPLDQMSLIDVAVDGADEFDPKLRLTKGGGGALLREKIIASAAKMFVVVTDSSKQVPVLGAFPTPVEIIPFAATLLTRRISALGAAVVLRKAADGAPFRTDEGHHILDCRFGRIPDPPALARNLSEMPGVVEHGLFINMASVVLMAKGGEVVELRR